MLSSLSLLLPFPFSSYMFGFRQQYSTSHALINITEIIRKALDDGNIGCGVFVDLQKAFDTVDHQVLLAKLFLLKAYISVHEFDIICLLETYLDSTVLLDDDGNFRV